MNEDRILGSILGVALGDALGAPFEGGLPERAVWGMIGKKKGLRRYTDDTAMALDIVESLISCRAVDQDDLAKRFANSYEWSRGYGPGASKLLARIRKGEDWREARRSVFRDGSYGNGGAMRVAPIGVFFAEKGEEAVVKAADATAEITHAHELGREGAVLIALAVALAYLDSSSEQILQRLSIHSKSPAFQARLKTAARWLASGELRKPRVIGRELGNSIEAEWSCVTAVYTALAYREKSFKDMQEYVMRIGGDVDTIGSMAGGIWGAARGYEALPKECLEQLEQRERIEGMARELARVRLVQK